MNEKEGVVNNEGGGEGTPDNSAATTETKARSMGWAPKDQWKGDEAKWMDAESFVRRGEEMLPFIRADNRRLREQLTTLQQQRQADQELLQASTEAIEDLKKFNTEITKERVKARRTELANEIKEARESGDVERELELKEQYDESGAALKEAEGSTATKKPIASTETAPHENPEFKQWTSENPWFGKDVRRTNYAVATANDLKAQDPSLKGRALLDKVNEEVDKVFGGNVRREGAAKVEGGNGGTGGNSSGGNSNGKSYTDLPPDAKKACDSQGKRLIGPGRAFKDEKSWRAHYIQKYFE